MKEHMITASAAVFSDLAPIPQLTPGYLGTNLN